MKGRNRIILESLTRRPKQHLSAIVTEILLEEELTKSRKEKSKKWNFDINYRRNSQRPSVHAKKGAVRNVNEEDKSLGDKNDGVTIKTVDNLG